MRITHAQFGKLMHNTSQRNTAKLADVMQRIASGDRILRVSDDTVGSTRLARLDRDNKRLDQYLSNIGVLAHRFQRNEVQMSGIVAQIQEARTTLVRAGDSSTVPDDMKAAANTIDLLRESMMAAANAKDNDGNYVFSGTAVGAPPVKYDPAAGVGMRYSFEGNTGKQMVVVGDGVTQSANVSLDEMAALLNALEVASKAMDENAPDASERARRTLSAVDNALESVSGKIAAQGGAHALLDVLKDTYNDVLSAGEEASEAVRQVDPVKASSELASYTIAIQATQKTYARIMELSLFNFV
jgi:flagellar hook-associated protein 3 FlgL